MRDVILSRINPDMFSMINKYCKRNQVHIAVDGERFGTLKKILYIHQTGYPDEIRMETIEEDREWIMNFPQEFWRYSINY